MLNAHIAAQAIVNAWDGWTDEDSVASDNILQAAVGYAKTILLNAPHQIPDDVYVYFVTAITVISDEIIPGITTSVANLTFDEAIQPLRAFTAKAQS